MHHLKRISVRPLFILTISLLTVCVSCRPDVGYNDGYKPEQPIPYDHKLHAGDLQIPCLYCHTNANKSLQATVPSLNICMNCHLTVRGKDGKESKHINKLIDAYMTGKSVQWNRVHLLPDFVQFNHKRHVKANIDCQRCHGPIETMKKVEQFSTLSMGWCLDCHGNKESKHGDITSRDCTTCHH